jgi:hypothetical protein
VPAIAGRRSRLDTSSRRHPGGGCATRPHDDGASAHGARTPRSPSGGRLRRDDRRHPTDPHPRPRRADDAGGVGSRAAEPAGTAPRSPHDQRRLCDAARRDATRRDATRWPGLRSQGLVNRSVDAPPAIAGADGGGLPQPLHGDGAAVALRAHQHVLVDRAPRRVDRRLGQVAPRQREGAAPRTERLTSPGRVRRGPARGAASSYGRRRSSRRRRRRRSGWVSTTRSAR